MMPICRRASVALAALALSLPEMLVAQAQTLQDGQVATAGAAGLAGR